MLHRIRELRRFTLFNEQWRRIEGDRGSAAMSVNVLDERNKTGRNTYLFVSLTLLFCPKRARPYTTGRGLRRVRPAVMSYRENRVAVDNT